MLPTHTDPSFEFKLLETPHHSRLVPWDTKVMRTAILCAGCCFEGRVLRGLRSYTSPDRRRVQDSRDANPLHVCLVAAAGASGSARSEASDLDARASSEEATLAALEDIEAIYQQKAMHCGEVRQKLRLATLKRKLALTHKCCKTGVRTF